MTYNPPENEYNFLFTGNEFAGLTIRSKEVIERAKTLQYPVTDENGIAVLTSPDGYKFYILNEPQPIDQGIIYVYKNLYLY